MVEWTENMLSSLDDAALKVLRQNAVRKQALQLVAMCDEEVTRRRPSRVVGDNNQSKRVRVFHFVCPRKHGVTRHSDGTISTGVWVVDPSRVEVGAYVALHEAKKALSYLQGEIIDWRIDPRDHRLPTGELVGRERGVTFKLKPTAEPKEWVGDGAGEKGYAY